MSTLNDFAEIDHVFVVHADGTYTDADHGIYAPTLHERELDDPRWEFFSHGYTSQHGYSGPILHNSESIGGRLEHDILARPGTYAAVVASWDANPDLGDSYDDLPVEGWAVVRLKD